MAPDDPDVMLRAAARARGFRVVKSRRRKRGGDHGKYGLTDAAGKELLGFGKDGLTASFDEVEAYLREGEASAWATSVETAKGPSPRAKARRAGDAAPPKRGRSEAKTVQTRAAASRPSVAERAEAPLRIRRASKADARAVATLLHAVYPGLDAELLARRLAARNGSALVAVKDAVVGVLAWSSMSLLHRGEVARIALVHVEDRYRRKGIGTALIKAAEERLTDCDAIEAVSDIEIRNAHRFFGAMGYAKTSYRFFKTLKG